MQKENKIKKNLKNNIMNLAYKLFLPHITTKNSFQPISKQKQGKWSVGVVESAEEKRIRKNKKEIISRIKKISGKNSN